MLEKSNQVNEGTVLTAFNSSNFQKNIVPTSAIYQQINKKKQVRWFHTESNKKSFVFEKLHSITIYQIRLKLKLKQQYCFYWLDFLLDCSNRIL